MSPYLFYPSALLCVFFSSPLSPPDHESGARDHSSISFNTTYHQVDGYTTRLVSWDTPVSCPALTPVMIRVSSPASTLCDKCRTSLLRCKKRLSGIFFPHQTFIRSSCCHFSSLIFSRLPSLSLLTPSLFFSPSPSG